MPETNTNKTESKTRLKAYATRDSCRLCHQENLELIWDFGYTPLANSYLPQSALKSPEITAPLKVWRCQDCELVQLRDVVTPKLLFDHYLYVSSTSPSFQEHFQSYARQLINDYSLTNQSFVVDVGSNDGILLKPLQDAGIKILGIDPAQNIAEQATAAGLTTLNAYFTPEVARQIVSEHGQADIVTANNVFAHTDDIDIFIAATKILLNDNGVFVFEVQYLGDLIKNNLFDIVYHEHVNYYHLLPLVSYFAAQDMQVCHVEKVAAHGGSMRVFVKKNAGSWPISPKVQELLTEESAQNLGQTKPFEDFYTQLRQNKARLHQIISEIKSAGHSICGYGAPAKATTLTHFFGINSSHLDFIVDDSPLKQGHYMPGTHIPIVNSSELYEKNPAYCLILAWNFADPIQETHSQYQKQGGTFILPMPIPNIIS